MEVDRVPELMLGDSSSLRDLVEGAGLVSPSFSLSSSRWRVFSTWMIGPDYGEVIYCPWVKGGGCDRWDNSGILMTHLMQLLHFLQLPLVLHDQTVSSGPPPGQVLFSTHVSHRCVQHLSPPPLHPCKRKRNVITAPALLQGCQEASTQSVWGTLTWTSCVRHLTQAQLVDASDSIAVTEERLILFM